MPLAADGPTGEGSATQMPGFLHEPFAAAMSQSLLLPAFIALFGVVAAMFLLGFGDTDAPEPARAEAVDEYDVDDDDVDDDDYVEFIVVHDDEPAPVAPIAAVVPAPFVGTAAPVAQVVDAAVDPAADESYTEPIPRVVPPVEPPAVQPLPAPVEHADWSVEPFDPLGEGHDPVRSLYDFLTDVAPPKPSVEPIGFAHNGFHTDDDEHFQPLSHFRANEDEQLSRVEPLKPDVLQPDYPLHFGSHAHFESPDAADEAGFDAPPRHGLADDDNPSNGRHSRTEPDDASSIGRHGRHWRPGD
jgi:hypothetical protein